MFPDCFSINARPGNLNPPGLGKFTPNFSIDFNKYAQDNGNRDVITTVLLCQNETKNNCPDSSLAYVVRNGDYDGRVRNGDDVALIILPEGQKITTIRPVTLNRNRKVPEDGQEVEAFGWGRTNQTEQITPNIVQTGKLKHFINPERNDPTIMFARTTSSNGVAVGRGDSGACNLLASSFCRRDIVVSFPIAHPKSQHIRRTTCYCSGIRRNSSSWRGQFRVCG
jgi:hypothetical protein